MHSSRTQHRTSGYTPGAPRMSRRTQALQVLQGCMGAAAVVALFAAAGWLDQHTELQNELASTRRQVELARAFDAGVQRGLADSLASAETAWRVALDEKQYQHSVLCTGGNHGQ